MESQKRLIRVLIRKTKNRAKPHKKEPTLAILSFLMNFITDKMDESQTNALYLLTGKREEKDDEKNRSLRDRLKGLI